MCTRHDAWWLRLFRAIPPAGVHQFPHSAHVARRRRWGHSWLELCESPPKGHAFFAFYPPSVQCRPLAALWRTTGVVMATFIYRCVATKSCDGMAQRYLDDDWRWFGIRWHHHSRICQPAHLFAVQYISAPATHRHESALCDCSNSRTNGRVRRCTFHMTIGTAVAYGRPPITRETTSRTLEGGCKYRHKSIDTLVLMWSVAPVASLTRQVPQSTDWFVPLKATDLTKRHRQVTCLSIRMLQFRIERTNDWSELRATTTTTSAGSNQWGRGPTCS